MPCYHPLKGYRSKAVNPSGKRSITFNAKEGFHDLRVDLACGQCIGCRLQRSCEWAVRCVHEASLHEENSFITLTYRPEDLPGNGSLVLEHFQLFMKRLRERISPRKIRFFHCGEYGDKGDRPHYHALLFGFDFPDRKYLKTVNGYRYYTSELLDEIWEKGFCIVGDVTFESAAYVARYVTKKITGPRSKQHYGERKAEYTTMSRRPGVGKGWYDKFSADVFPDDFIVIDGRRVCVPKFYRSLLESGDSFAHAKVRAGRQVSGRKMEGENSPERLRVKKKVKQAQLGFLKRGIE